MGSSSKIPLGQAPKALKQWSRNIAQVHDGGRVRTSSIADVLQGAILTVLTFATGIWDFGLFKRKHNVDDSYIIQTTDG